MLFADHAGISTRDESVDARIELAADLGIHHELASCEEEFGIRMDDIVDDDPVAYCGVLRRDLLETDAEELEADLLLTGHNIDDEAQTALMNVPEGNVEQMAKRFHVSLRPSGGRVDRAGFVPGEAAPGHPRNGGGVVRSPPEPPGAYHRVSPRLGGVLRGGP